MFLYSVGACIFFWYCFDTCIYLFIFYLSQINNIIKKKVYKPAGKYESLCFQSSRPQDHMSSGHVPRWPDARSGHAGTWPLDHMIWESGALKMYVFIYSLMVFLLCAFLYLFIPFFLFSNKITKV